MCRWKVMVEGGGGSASRKLYAELMRKCGERKALGEAKRVHEELVERRLDVDAYLGSGIVEMYVKCGSLADAHGVHDGLPQRNEFSWTALISGYASSGQSKEAVRVYEAMREEGVKPSSFTLVQALKACGSCMDWEAGKKIHSHVVESGFQSDMHVGNTLIDMYAKCGCMLDATRLFHHLPRPDVVSWTAMILGYAQQEQGEVALQMYTQMQQQGIVPDDRAYVGALKACSALAKQEVAARAVDGRVVKAGSLEKGRSIHAQVVKAGLEQVTFVGNTLMDMYATCGSMVDAQNVFDRLPRPDVVSWNVIILGHASQTAGQQEAAFRLYAQMLQQGASPDSVTLVSILKACGSTGCLDRGRRIHSHIRRGGNGAAGTTLAVATALVDMYGKCGSMADAQHVFDALATKDAVTWSALMAGYGRQGDVHRVFHLFHQMGQQGVKADPVTFLALLTACSHAGLVSQGQAYFHSMLHKHGLAPTIQHYNCLVDLLGRAGKMDQAVGVVREMPFQPDLVTWKTLLAACQKWSDVEVGRRAFRHAVRMDGKQAAPYVVMCNIYADAGMWAERDELQGVREQAGARKEEAGRSWWHDEVGGEVHTFVVGDEEHPHSPQIHAALTTLAARMKLHAVT